MQKNVRKSAIYHIHNSLNTFKVKDAPKSRTNTLYIINYYVQSFTVEPKLKKRLHS